MSERGRPGERGPTGDHGQDGQAGKRGDSGIAGRPGIQGIPGQTPFSRAQATLLTVFIVALIGGALVAFAVNAASSRDACEQANDNARAINALVDETRADVAKVTTGNC